MGHGRIIIRPSSFLRKQTGQMFKLFNLWKKVKNPTAHETYRERHHTAPPIAREGKPVFLTNTLGLNTKYITRRQIVLNRHFTEIISDVLINNLKEPLENMSITITSIESKAWNKGVNIFYHSKGAYDEDTHRKLNSLVADLRAAITERQLIGRTPSLSFVFDEVSQIEQSLDDSLRMLNIEQSEPTTDLTQTSADITAAKKCNYESKTKLNQRYFHAPADMCNMALGIDYVNLYNKVAEKVDQGRGESARMPTSTSLASRGPFIQIPREETIDDDPAMRIMRMQKFLVNQRQKKEHLSRIRRKDELLHRDRIKWDLNDEEPEKELNVDELEQ